MGSDPGFAAAERAPDEEDEGDDQDPAEGFDCEADATQDQGEDDQYDCDVHDVSFYQVRLGTRRHCAPTAESDFLVIRSMYPGGGRLKPRDEQPTSRSTG